MSERAIAFVENWVTENIEAKGYQAEAGQPSAETLAARCLMAAKAQGIPQSEIDAAFEDLSAFMAGQIAEANDREQARLAANSD
jgi:predicted metal-dependent hydrolase